MAERDPFGRLPDENPLAGLGTLSEGTESQNTEPVVAGETAPWTEGRAAKARPAASPPQPADPALAEAIRRAEAFNAAVPAAVVRSVGRVVRIVFVIAVIAVIAGVGSTIFETGKGVRDRSSELPSPQRNGEETAGGERSRVPSGFSSRSLLVKGNVARSMRRLRASGLGRMRSMTVRAERIDAQLLTRGGRLRSVQLPWTGALADFGVSAGGLRNVDSIPYATIDSAAPGRLVRSAAGRSRKPVTEVDYVVLISFSGKPLWSAVMKDGDQFLADAHGAITSKVN